MVNVRKIIIGKNIYGYGNYGSNLYGAGEEVLIENNWQYSYSIKKISTLRCKVIESVYIPEKGNNFELYIDDVLEFGGIITSIKSYESQPGFLAHDLVVQDYSKLLDNRRIGHSFEDKTAGYIINWMIDNILYEEGISAGTIEDAMEFDRVVFAYKTCTDAINYIAAATPGYNWIIDKNKKIHFISKYKNKCNSIINDTFQHYDFSTELSLDQYINALYVEGGKKQTTLIENYSNVTPAPDGVSRTFVLPFPLALEPVIQVNTGGGWVTQTVGINGLTESKQFYWTYGSDSIIHDPTETVLAVGTLIRVTFTGLIDIRLVIRDEAKIAEMNAAEIYSTGVYEGIYVDKNITTDKNAYIIGYSVIEKYSKLDTITFKCQDIQDLSVNKLIYVDKLLFGISGWFLIESINASNFNPEVLTYEVTLLYGDSLGSWEQYFKSLLNQSTNINTEDVFIQTKSLKDIYSYEGELDIVIYTPQKCSPSLIISPDLVMGDIKSLGVEYD